MDFHQVNGFLRVFQQKNVSVAAKQLHISQSALSRQIASLEHDLGAALFKRTGEGMCLTPFGETFLPEACRIADDVNQAMHKLRGVVRGHSILRVGHVPSLMIAFIADAMLAYSQQYPEVHIEMSEAPAMRQIELLREGFLDVVCTHAISQTDLSFDRIARVPLLLVTSLRSECERNQDKSSLKRHRDQTFIIPDRKRYPNGELIVQEACRRVGYEPKIIELEGISTVLMAIALGKGITILPAHFCLLPHPGVRYDSLPFFVPESDVIALTRKQSRNESLQPFINLMRKQAAIRYQRKFWKNGDEANQITFPGNDRRRSLRRRHS